MYGEHVLLVELVGPVGLQLRFKVAGYWRARVGVEKGLEGGVENGAGFLCCELYPLRFFRLFNFCQMLEVELQRAAEVV